MSFNTNQTGPRFTKHKQEAGTVKATGIVRRIDDLGRVVIPKEIRRTMRIREGDPLEIYTNSNEVIFKKYSPLSELGTVAGQYAEVIYEKSRFQVVVCDCDCVVAVAGLPKKELLGRRVSPALEDYMRQRKSFAYSGDEDTRLKPVEGVGRFAIACAPVIAGGDICGSIMLLAEEDSITAGDTEVVLLAIAAAFLGKQMEE